MKIVIVGGTGLIGSKLVETFLRSGHIVVPASPQTGVNTFTGEGVHEALKGADVVVDVSNPPSLEGKAVLDFFQRSTLNQLATEVYTEVKHHIILSAMGAGRLPDSSFFRAKLMQEELVRESGVHYTILRSSPFFELAHRIAQAATIGEEVYISPAAFQPIAANEVIKVLSAITLGTPLDATLEVAGPVLMPMYEFIRYYLNATEDPRQLVMDEDALYFGSKLNDQSLAPGEESHLGKIKYEDWFRSQLLSNDSPGPLI